MSIFISFQLSYTDLKDTKAYFSQIRPSIVAGYPGVFNPTERRSKWKALNITECFTRIFRDYILLEEKASLWSPTAHLGSHSREQAPQIPQNSHLNGV